MKTIVFLAVLGFYLNSTAYASLNPSTFSHSNDELTFLYEINNVINSKLPKELFKQKEVIDDRRNDTHKVVYKITQKDEYLDVIITDVVNVGNNFNIKLDTRNLALEKRTLLGLINHSKEFVFSGTYDLSFSVLASKYLKAFESSDCSNGNLKFTFRGKKMGETVFLSAVINAYNTSKIDLSVNADGHNLIIDSKYSVLCKSFKLEGEQLLKDNFDVAVSMPMTIGVYSGMISRYAPKIANIAVQSIPFLSSLILAPELPATFRIAIPIVDFVNEIKELKYNKIILIESDDNDK